MDDDTSDCVILLECNLDDMTGEALGYALEKLLEAGALDAWFTPIYMKKNRPAVLLSVLCTSSMANELTRLLLEHTSTLGVRWCEMERTKAQRVMDTVQTPWGPVRRKVKMLGTQVVSAKPEYEDCARIAREAGVTLQEVLEAAYHVEPPAKASACEG